jgi:hypothetical protein
MQRFRSTEVEHDKSMTKPDKNMSIYMSVEMSYLSTGGSVETNWIALQVSANADRGFEEPVAQAMEASHVQGRGKEALSTLPSLPSGHEHEILLRHRLRSSK